jgi:putative membrane protein
MAEKNIFTKFSKDELILRDYLAVYRTVLANEQAFLSYVRTALATAATGASLIHFVNAPLTKVIGWILVGGSILLMVYGASRYKEMKDLIELERDELEDIEMESQVPMSFIHKFLYWKQHR